MGHVGIRRNFWFHVGACEANIGTFVAHLVAVVGCAENSQGLAAFLVLVAVRLDLVAPDQ